MASGLVAIAISQARVTIYAGVVLGDGVVVQAGAVLGSTGFGYARNAETGEYVLFPQQGRLVIEDDVEIGANTTIDRGALGETRIGRGTKIDNLVHIGHNCVIGKNVVIAAQTGISGSSVVEDGAILGGQVGIGEHATVGEGVILGGGAGVLSGKKMRGQGRGLLGAASAAFEGVSARSGAVEAHDRRWAMAIVVVGGHSRNIGKTSVVEGLIRGTAGDAVDGVQDYAVWAWDVLGEWGAMRLRDGGAYGGGERGEGRSERDGFGAVPGGRGGAVVLGENADRGSCRRRCREFARNWSGRRMR